MWKNGKTSAVITDIPHTNGLAFSPDEKILYANGSRDRFVRAYDVQPDGTLPERPFSSTEPIEDTFPADVLVYLP